ncbi:hypothetical protein KIPB_008799 [Kipferlia bialata]|uniref:Metallo-beta-lactamase domain-containing protein n=1 Tax=Kipferlia bialata TaxID=797122 RepID=A0A9K3D2G4_9EUKA|nr:hypothetical protein KIPB_008799 [Kipferlia bialata]|eukprot:g8799.t1
METKSATELLQGRVAEFDTAIYNVAEGVHVAMGYSVSPITMVVGTTGVLIVDTGMDLEEGHKVAKAFKEITPLPVVAMVYTHGHGDHLGGARAFVPEDTPAGAPAPFPVFARDNFMAEARQFEDVGLTIQNKRGAKQAGFLLPRDKRICNGVAKVFYPKRKGSVFTKAGSGKVAASESVSEHMCLSLGGIDFELFPTAGEAPDSMYIWVPERKVLLTGDLFYKSWPHTYPIRGTMYRDVLGWVNSLTNMLSLPFEVVVGGHTRPVTEGAREVLTNYRDGVEHVFRSTIDCINKGMTPDEIVEVVSLPEHLQGLDYLRGYYGNLEWTIRGIFCGFLGWFDGNPTGMFPLRRIEHAKRMAGLAGGVDRLMTACTEALAKKDFQWCSMLCDHLLVLSEGEDSLDRPSLQLMKSECLEGLAVDTLTATGRNFYLTVAQDLRKSAKGE